MSGCACRGQQGAGQRGRQEIEYGCVEPGRGWSECWSLGQDKEEKAPGGWGDACVHTFLLARVALTDGGRSRRDVCAVPETERRSPCSLPHLDFTSNVHVVGITMLLFIDKELRLSKVTQLAKMAHANTGRL